MAEFRFLPKPTHQKWVATLRWGGKEKRNRSANNSHLSLNEYETGFVWFFGSVDFFLEITLIKGPLAHFQESRTSLFGVTTSISNSLIFRACSNEVWLVWVKAIRVDETIASIESSRSLLITATRISF
jgi:hypothetical protein